MAFRHWVIWIFLVIFSATMNQQNYKYHYCLKLLTVVRYYNMASLFRTISIIAYFFIFLQGSLILLPFGLLLLTGLFEAEPIMRVLIGLADTALLVLVIKSFYERNKWTPLIEIIAFFALLLPLLKTFTSFSLEWFDYFLFLFPIGCFIALFPLSILLGHMKYLRQTQKVEHNLEL